MYCLQAAVLLVISDFDMIFRSIFMFVLPKKTGADGYKTGKIDYFVLEYKFNKIRIEKLPERIFVLIYYGN